MLRSSQRKSLQKKESGLCCKCGTSRFSAVRGFFRSGGKVSIISRKSAESGAKTSFSADFWSEWPDSNRRHRSPKLRALPAAPHPDWWKYSVFSVKSVSGQICGQKFFAEAHGGGKARKREKNGDFASFRRSAHEAVTRSQSKRATNCATPRKGVFKTLIYYTRHGRKSQEPSLRESPGKNMAKSSVSDTCGKCKAVQTASEGTTAQNG